MQTPLRCHVLADPIVAVSRVAAVPTILRVITELTGLRLSLIAHVTDRAWTCCAVNDQLGFGLEVGGQLDVASTLCAEVRQARTPIVISQASTDPVYGQHRTPGLPAFESYLAVPISLRNGAYFGNLCAFDANPLELSAKTVTMFQLFAELIGVQLDAEAHQQTTSPALLDEHQTAQLREQLIAVLGHDLRTPLSAIVIGAEILEHKVATAHERTIVQRIRRSADRINRLANDILDFARGRLGGGVPLRTASLADLGATFGQVTDELRAAHPARRVEVEVGRLAPFAGDSIRLAQLLQNLLGNALAHSPSSALVTVQLRDDDNHLVIAVSNGGPKLPPALVQRMFEPVERGTAGRPAGLELGLYIAAEIVRAHRGTITADSDDVATTVTCRLPRARA